MANELIFLFYTALIAIGLGFFFKFFVKPKIEIIYENNRRNLIRRMLNRIYQLDRGMSNIFQIMMRQPEFDPNEERAYELSQQDLDLINIQVPIVNTVFDEFDDFALKQHWRSHLRDEEFESMLQYVHFSHQFVLRLIQPLHIYHDLDLEARKGFCFEMIQELLMESLIFLQWDYFRIFMVHIEMIYSFLQEGNQKNQTLMPFF